MSSWDAPALQLSPRGDDKLSGTSLAAHELTVGARGIGRSKRRSAFVVYPAIGALVLRVDLELVFEQALWREARRLALRLHLQLQFLYLLKPR